MGKFEYIVVRWHTLFNQDRNGAWAVEWDAQVVQSIHKLQQDALEVKPPVCFLDVHDLWQNALAWYFSAVTAIAEGRETEYYSAYIQGLSNYMAAVKAFVAKEEQCE